MCAWVSACAGMKWELVVFVYVWVLLSRTALVWWMEWGVSPAGDRNEALWERVCVCVHEGGADRTRLSFTKLSSRMKTDTRTNTHSDHRLRDDECGTQCSPQLQGSNLHGDPVSPFLTGKSENRGHSGAVRRDKDGWCRWWPGPRDQAGWCWEFLCESNGSVLTCYCGSRELLPAPHDRCFIILMITSHIFHVTSCLESY